MGVALAIHGGAWNIPDGEVEAHFVGIERTLRGAWARLLAGASALDTVEHAVRLLEDDPTFNAGRGGHLNRSGRLELDASIMDGEGLKAGAVAAIEGVLHPVSVARAVLERSPHVLLAGRGAKHFARHVGAELCRTRDLLVGRELKRYERIRSGERYWVDHEFKPLTRHPHGTVGAVALDRAGRTAAATSTGGTQDKWMGRVGDSPIIGAGTYADARSGAVSCTGWGESILKVVLAKEASNLLMAGLTAGSAARRAIRELARVRGWGGLIVVDRAGCAAAAFNTPRMARGLATERRGLRVAVEGRKPTP